MVSLGNAEINTISNLRKEGDTTLFTWTVGRWRKRGFGDGITSSTPVQAGDDEWKLTFYPKGFTDPDWASLYVTNITCDLDDGDPLEPNRITTSALASVKVTFTPMFPGKKDGPGGGTGGGAGGSGGSKAGTSSLAGTILSSMASTVPSMSSGGKSSKRSGKSSKAGSQAGGGGKKVDLEPVVKTLSTQFSNLESSWGWEQYLDLDKLYSIRSGYAQDVPDQDPTRIVDGRISMDVEILAVTGIDFESPVNDPEITPEGRLRTRWIIKDFYTLVKKVQGGQKVSSSSFESDGEWFLDIYPRGYRTVTNPGDDGYMSVYLHSTRKQVELGETLKQTFCLGIKKANRFETQDYIEKLGERPMEAEDDVYFPPGSSVVAIFTPEQKCFGKQRFLRVNKDKGPLREVPENRKKQTSSIKDFDQELVAGTYTLGGAITIILDMAVTDVEIGSVQHMLHMSPAFDNPHLATCPDSGAKFDRSPMFGGCQAKAPCYWCGKMYNAEVLRSGRISRFPDWGFEVGAEFVMDCLMREEEHELYRAMSKFSLDKKLEEGMSLMQARVASMVVTKKKSSSHQDASDDPSQLSGQRKKLWEKEVKIQKKFQMQLDELRTNLEDAQMSKPVCAKCFEMCKEYQSNRQEQDTCLYARLPDLNRPRILDKRQPQANPYETNFAYKWREQKKKCADTYRAMNECMSTITRWGGGGGTAEERAMVKSLTGGGNNAMTLAKGGWYCEPQELVRQCPGRVNVHDPKADDDDLDREGFCDVRFDRRSGAERSAPKALLCHASGRHLCKNCCRWKAPMPELMKDPAKAVPVAMSLDYYEKRGEKEPGRIQPVSNKPPVDDSKSNKKSSAAAKEEEEEEDDDEGVLGLIRGVPFCGEKIADSFNPEA